MPIPSNTAVFLKGLVGDDALLRDPRPLLIFMGRSNAGKSSTINALIGRRSLVRVSATPGKTTEFNMYEINGNTLLMDLPGYGYARRSHAERIKMGKRLSWLLSESGVAPCLVLLIVDSAVGLTADDRAMVGAVLSAGHPLVIVANKADKLRKNDIAKAVSAIVSNAGAVPVFAYSAKTRYGDEELSSFISERIAACQAASTEQTQEHE